LDDLGNILEDRQQPIFYNNWGDKWPRYTLRRIKW
jgi:hypothetical protein